ncbi:hypothetical protein ACFL2Q_15620 [Thermodesulfobacteriota bacterium]
MAAGFLLVGLAILAAGTESMGRILLPKTLGYGKRAAQPYLMNGFYYGGHPTQYMMSREGPTAYGYENIAARPTCTTTLAGSIA